jgi:hypothetical protein
MFCLDSFPWAKERAGETTSNTIEIERSLLNRKNFFLEGFNFVSHLGTLLMDEQDSRSQGAKGSS